MQKEKKVFIGAFIIVIIILIAMIFVIPHQPIVRSRPWFGRGQHLPELPYCVLVGPIDAQRGINGVLELGMTKAELHKNLGKPLVSALSNEEASKMITSNSSDEEGHSLNYSDFENEFYGGVFAWVRYDINGRVGLISFEPTAFKKGLNGKQKVVISVRGYSFIVDDQTSKTTLIRLLKSAKPRIDFDLKWNDSRVELKGSHLNFNFNAVNSKLTYISISTGDKVM